MTSPEPEKERELFQAIASHDLTKAKVILSELPTEDSRGNTLYHKVVKLSNIKALEWVDVQTS